MARDLLAPGLLLVICGYNPSLSAGHAYTTPTCPTDSGGYCALSVHAGWTEREEGVQETLRDQALRPLGAPQGGDLAQPHEIRTRQDHAEQKKGELTPNARWSVPASSTRATTSPRSSLWATVAAEASTPKTIVKARKAPAFPMRNVRFLFISSIVCRIMPTSRFDRIGTK